MYLRADALVYDLCMKSVINMFGRADARFTICINLPKTLSPNKLMHRSASHPVILALGGTKI